MSTLEKGFHPERQEFDGLFNCIMYALGNESASRIFEDFLNNKEIFPSEAFEETCKALEINCEQISSYDDSIHLDSNEYIICLCWWREIDKTFEYPFTDYHVIRKGSDGKWMQKDGIRRGISEVPTSEIPAYMEFADKAFFKIRS